MSVLVCDYTDRIAVIMNCFRENDSYDTVRDEGIKI